MPPSRQGKLSNSRLITRNVSFRDFAATLIIAICVSGLTATAQIGDGAVVTATAPAENEERAYELFSKPQRGKYVNETNFITADNWRDELCIRVDRCRVDRVAMFTDGIQSMSLVAASDNSPHPPLFRKLFQWAENICDDDEDRAETALEAFLSSAVVTSRTEDDKTLLLGVLREAGGDDEGAHGPEGEDAVEAGD